LEPQAAANVEVMYAQVLWTLMAPRRRLVCSLTVLRPIWLAVR